jgi:hypothetical protein
VAEFSGFIPVHGLRPKALFHRILKTGHVPAPGLDIALKNASPLLRIKILFLKSLRSGGRPLKRSLEKELISFQNFEAILYLDSGPRKGL